MWRCVAMYLCLIAIAGANRAVADEKANELARLAGKYTAESSVRTGQIPATKEVLKQLSLEINNEKWVQNFRGDIAPYTITLDLKDNSKGMRLTHQRVQAVRNVTYDLKGDTLTVTEPLGQDGEIIVTVWKRKPRPVN